MGKIDLSARYMMLSCMKNDLIREFKHNEIIKDI